MRRGRETCAEQGHNHIDHTQALRKVVIGKERRFLGPEWFTHFACPPIVPDALFAKPDISRVDVSNVNPVGLKRTNDTLDLGPVGVEKLSIFLLAFFGVVWISAELRQLIEVCGAEIEHVGRRDKAEFENPECIVELHQRGHGKAAYVRDVELAESQIRVTFALVSSLATVYLDRRLAVR